MDEEQKDVQSPADTAAKGRRPRKKRPPAIDDGRTVAEMNVEGFPWYDKHRDERRDYTKKERRRILRAAYLRMLPVLAVMLLGMTLAALLMWLIL